MRTICLKFITDENKNYRVNLGYAAENLETADGVARVKKALEAVMKCDPFNVGLSGVAGAELTERRNINLG